MEEKEIVIEIKSPYLIATLAFLLIIFGLEMKVMLESPIVFGDSGFHARMAQWIAKKIEYPIWFTFERTKLRATGYERPPLFNFLVAGFLFFLGNFEFWIKFIDPFVSFLMGLATFLLLRKIFNERISFIASVLVVTVPSFVTYAVLVYTDVLFTFYFTLFFLTFILFEEKKDKKYLLLSGIFAGLTVLTKRPGFTIFPFFALVILYDLIKRRDIVKTIEKYWLWVIIVLILTLPFFGRNVYYYKNPICSKLPFFDTSHCSINLADKKYQFAGRTERVGTEQDVITMGITNYLNFAYGPVWFVPLSFFCGLFLIKWQKDSKWIFVWLMLANLILLAILRPTAIWIKGRAENTARYTLGWVSVIALISAFWFDKIFEFIQTYYKKIAYIVFVFVVVVSLILSFYPKLMTMEAVKQFSPLFFEACDWIKSNLPENVTLMSIWAHRAVYNAQRTCAPNLPDIVLARNVSEIVTNAKKHGITHLFIQKFSIDPNNKHYSEKYDADFVRLLEDNPKVFVKVFENGPSFNDPQFKEQCLQTGRCDGNIIYEINYTAV